MTTEIAQPTIYVIAGPNGAGKTTFANSFLQDYVNCTEFLNADLIASGLSPFAPDTQAVRASELMLERISELAGSRRTFAFETTLAARSYRRRIIEWQSIGFTVHLLFIWLPTADMAVARVANRVRQGGHGIPEDTIRRRYSLGLRNLRELYCPVVNHWSVFDGSQLPPKLIAQSAGASVIIHNQAIWRYCQTFVGENP